MDCETALALESRTQSETTNTRTAFRVYATCDIGEPAQNRLRENGYKVEVYPHADPPP